MMLRLCLAVAVVALVSLETACAFQFSSQTSFARSCTSSVSRSSKLHAYKGNVFDQEQRAVDMKKKKKFQGGLNFDVGDTLDEADLEQYEKGDDLRSARERKLAVVVAEQPEVIPDTTQTRTAKKTQDEIDTIIECLNLSIGKEKSTAELSDTERVGLVNWEAFDGHATLLVGDYVSDAVGVATPSLTKLRNWVEFHRKKKDISFSHLSAEGADDPDGEPMLFSWAAKPYNRKNWRGRDAK